MEGQSRVFGIGLNKTGTRSLALAMRQLGYRTLHKGDAATSALVDLAAEERIPLLSHIGDQFDAYFDVAALVRRFAELDHQYPGSKFILTTRAVDGWLASREKHVRANQAAGKGGWVTVDHAAWLAQREAHHTAVLRHFSARPGSLLVIDVIAGEGWDALCPFLERSVPRVPFPWENRGGVGTYTSRLGRPVAAGRRFAAALNRLRG